MSFVRFVNDSTVIALQDEIVDNTIEIRRHKIKTPDAIIAAFTQIRLILISRNEKDFKISRI